MNQNLTPQRVDAQGRIFSTDEDGVTHIHHTDAEEAATFFAVTKALSAGRDEMWLLLHAEKTADGAVLRQQDGRNTEELKADWLRKVTQAGIEPEAAISWLTKRLAIEGYVS